MGASVLLPENAITVIRGASKTLELTVTDPDDTPIVLENVKIYFTVKNTVKETSTLIQKTSDVATQILITKPREGKAEIYLKPEDTQDKEAKQYVFDVWLVFTATGKRYPVVQPSIFEVQAGVTLLPL